MESKGVEKIKQWAKDLQNEGKCLKKFCSDTIKNNFGKRGSPSPSPVSGVTSGVGNVAIGAGVAAAQTAAGLTLIQYYRTACAKCFKCEGDMGGTCEENQACTDACAACEEAKERGHSHNGSL